jgi:hypothetical protein
MTSNHRLETGPSDVLILGVKDPLQLQSILTFVGLFAEPLVKLRTSSVNGRTRSILIT